MTYNPKWTSPGIREWCVKRGHPFVTYNPLSNDTWCRCGERVEPGEQPVDWDAKWAQFHNHDRDQRCACYLPDHRTPEAATQ